MLKQFVMAGALSLYLVVQAVYAQPEATGVASRNRNKPEEIVVEGERFKFQLREQIYDAEDNLYALFNSLIDENRFKITCTTDDRNNSRIKNRLCLPEFQRDATRIDGRAFLDIYRTQAMNPGELSAGSATMPSSPPAKFMIDKQQKELQAKMQELAKEHPEFLDALIQYTDLKDSYLQSFSGDE